ncbi:trace amine-associated receptor 13c-like [Carassius carassius]|uniref:trace amine-associated receptor 13c-like n=1 Tax=Carassius carassius TaxID=217509 RepID=UPI00286928C3|nr:trace amine-associated receptor 13c-like [Carassius carassius]
MAYETEDHEIQYCFPAINSSCIKGKRSRHEYNVLYVFFSLLSAWTVFLNLLVIISISHFKKLHTATNLIILSLAVADMLIGLIVIPIEAIKLIETCWYFGDKVCAVFINTLGLLLSASLCNLVFIAVDRYVAVCCPLQYPQKITTTKTLMSIILCWLCSLAYNTAIVTNNGYFDTFHKTEVCYGECPYMMSIAWRASDLILSFASPCIVIIMLYLRIFYVAQRQVKIINLFLKTGKRIMEDTLKKKSESKAALTLGIIVTVHLLCWIPFYIISLSGSTVNTAVMSKFLTWTLYINSGLNPIVYALFYPWFKKAVKYIITLRLCKPASSYVDIFKDYH